jgi:RNA polymerase sigma-70 factor, ECF subfamily
VIDEPTITLLHAAQNGDREAMHKLLQSWNDPLFGFLLGQLRNRSDAEDATQETLIRIVKGLPTYQHRGEFRAWVFCIARNQAALTATRRSRREGREVSLEPEALHSLPPIDPPADELAQAEQASQLRHAVAKLPDVEREVVELRLNEDLKFREIAERTGAPLNTVLGRMHNAISRLRETLQPTHSFTHS